MRNIVIGVLAGSVVTGFLFWLNSDSDPSPSTEASTIVPATENEQRSAIDQQDGQNAESPDSDAPSPADPSIDQSTDGSSPDSEPVVFRIPVLPELEDIVKTTNGSQMHGLLEREPLDSVWGPVTEAQLNLFYSQQPEVMKLGVPVVHCRSTICEIQLVAYGAAEVETGEWLRVLATGLNEQPWASGFRSAGIINGEYNGAATVLYHLRRPAE